MWRESSEPPWYRTWIYGHNFQEGKKLEKLVLAATDQFMAEVQWGHPRSSVARSAQSVSLPRRSGQRRTVALSSGSVVQLCAKQLMQCHPGIWKRQNHWSENETENETKEKNEWKSKNRALTGLSYKRDKTTKECQPLFSSKHSEFKDRQTFSKELNVVSHDTFMGAVHSWAGWLLSQTEFVVHHLTLRSGWPWLSSSHSIMARRSMSHLWLTRHNLGRHRKFAVDRKHWSSWATHKSWPDHKIDVDQKMSHFRQKIIIIWDE